VFERWLIVFNTASVGAPTVFSEGTDPRLSIEFLFGARGCRDEMGRVRTELLRLRVSFDPTLESFAEDIFIYLFY
jgi:hypothetical protein